ncbi:MAG TPA: PAS domain S-box protein, partial [Nitrospira sp.]
MIRFLANRSRFSSLAIPLILSLSLVIGAFILFGWFADNTALHDLFYSLDRLGREGVTLYLLIGLTSLGMAATVVLFIRWWQTTRSLEDVERRHKETVFALNQSEEEQRLAKFAVDHAGDAILWADMETRIVYANQMACRSLGYEREELLALTIADIVPHHDPRRYQERLVLLRTGQSAQYESRHRRKDGTQFPVEVVLNYVEQNGLGYTCAIVRDITARKHAEELLRQTQEALEVRVEERTHALRESQRRMELILEATAVATWDWNVVTGAVRYNAQWALNRGLRQDDVVSHLSSRSEGVHPDDRAPVLRALQEHLDGHTSFYEAEMRVRTAAGEWTWIMDRGRVVERDGEGKALRMAGIEIDITARKRAEHALQESEERYSSLVSQAPDVIYIAGLDGRFTYVNASACSIMGYQSDELIGMHYLDLIRQDIRGLAQQFYRKQLVERIPSTYFEFPGITKDGREIWFGQQVRLRVSDGQLVGVEAIARNITARKLAEEALLESEERTRAIVESSLDAVITIDERSVVTGWNPHATSVFGYTKE